MIKAVVFDLDDTLYNEMDFVKEGFRCVSTYLSNKYNMDKDKLLNEILDILKAHGRGKIFNIICDRYKFNEDVASLVEIYRNSKSRLTVYSDAKEILDCFKDKYKLGIITDGKASVQWNKINSLGIKNYFDKIIVTDDFGFEFWKPNEFAFKEIIKALKCEAKEAVYVGDNPNKDFIGARKVGLYTIRIIREFGDNMSLNAKKGYEADTSIKSLLELPNIIKNI
ncbi:hydrolase [Clostridium acetobutylicum]|nr:hydrolase [Clostridium acetobutylicum]